MNRRWRFRRFCGPLFCRGARRRAIPAREGGGTGRLLTVITSPAPVPLTGYDEIREESEP